MLLTKEAFGKDFIWGVSTAAYQIEGAHNLDGKGLSIWDKFVRKKNKIFQNHHGEIACDHYNRYVDDLHLMYSLNIRNYRFSISWSRIIPDGTGEINQAGIDFYNRLIDLSLELGITPWVTLYHWDLPHELEKKGGWVNRDIKDWFGEYVAICVRNGIQCCGLFLWCTCSRQKRYRLFSGSSSSCCFGTGTRCVYHQSPAPGCYSRHYIFMFTR